MVINFEDIVEAMGNRACKNCKHWVFNDNDKFAYRGSCAKMCYQAGLQFKSIYTDGDFVCLGWTPENKTKGYAMNDKVETIKTS